MSMIHVDHGGCARIQQVAEQPQLGGQISIEARMIVEMIAGDVGETARSNAQAIEPKLIEPM